MNTKPQVRKAISDHRKKLTSSWIRDRSACVADSFLKLDTFNRAKTVALYKAIQGEVDLNAVFLACWKLGKRTCIPVYNSEQNIYELSEVNPETEYSMGNYGIQEPRSTSLISASEIDLFAVPGVAFDSHGNRVGRGGGYYDRLLQNISGTAVAVAFDFQILPDVPFDAHDIRMHILITETKMVNVCNEH